MGPLWTPYADLEHTSSSTETVPTTSGSIYHDVHNLLHEGHHQPVTQQSPEGASSGYDSATYQVVPRTKISPQSSQHSSISRESEYEADQLSDDSDFQRYERSQLALMAERNGGVLFGENPKMRRTIRSGNAYLADDDYRSRRQRNNFAAKQSRDKRKMREIHLTIKVTYLKREMARLKAALRQARCRRCHRTHLAE